MSNNDFPGAICAVIMGLISLPASAVAETMIPEPDDFALETDVSNIPPYVCLSTFEGDPVYLSTIHRGISLAGQGNDSASLGNAVLSRSPNENFEFLLDLFAPLPLAGDGLLITFDQPRFIILDISG